MWDTICIYIYILYVYKKSSIVHFRRNRYLTYFVRKYCAGELLLPELNGNVTTSKMLPLPPINYKDVDVDTEIDGMTWCVDFPTSSWSQFCTLWKRMTLQLYRNKVRPFPRYYTRIYQRNILRKYILLYVFVSSIRSA